MVLWIVRFDFHLDLWEEVVEDRTLIFYSTLHQQGFAGMVLWGSVKDHLSPYILSTTPTSLKMKPVLVSSRGRVCGTRDLT